MTDYTYNNEPISYIEFQTILRGEYVNSCGDMCSLGAFNSLVTPKGKALIVFVKDNTIRATQSNLPMSKTYLQTLELKSDELYKMFACRRIPIRSPWWWD